MDSVFPVTIGKTNKFHSYSNVKSWVTNYTFATTLNILHNVCDHQISTLALSSLFMKIKERTEQTKPL